MFFQLIASLAMTVSSAQPGAQMEFPEALGPLIDEAYEAESAAIAQFECEIDDRSCLAEELIERFRVDQWAREQAQTMEICGAFAETHPQVCQMQIMGVAAFRGDVANLTRLKEIMAEHGWPSPPDFPAEAQRAAWYITQHGQYLDDTGTTRGDPDFAESVLPSVREAVEREELIPWTYGAMFDRIRRMRGEPQRYATQIMCENGEANFGALEDENRIDEFRAEIGMPVFDRAGYDAYCSGG